LTSRVSGLAFFFCNSLFLKKEKQKKELSCLFLKEKGHFFLSAMWNDTVVGDVLVQTLNVEDGDPFDVETFLAPNAIKPVQKHFMRWCYYEQNDTLMVFYTDSYNNFEIYCSQETDLDDLYVVLGEIKDLGKTHHWRVFKVAPHLMYENEGESLKDVRLCLFNVDANPAESIIIQVMAVFSTTGASAESICAQLYQNGTQSRFWWNNTFAGDVLVQTMMFKEGASLNAFLVPFLKPDTESIKHAKVVRWCAYDYPNTNRILFYVDSFNNYEIYYHDKEALLFVAGRITDFGAYNWRTFEVPNDWLNGEGYALRDARICLFNVEQNPAESTIVRMLEEFRNGGWENVCAKLQRTRTSASPVNQKQSWTAEPMAVSPAQKPSPNSKTSSTVPPEDNFFEDTVEGDVLVQTLKGEDFDPFFNPPKSTKYKKWMRWKFVDQGDMMLVLYFDSSNNLEIYHSKEDDLDDVQVAVEPLQYAFQKYNPVVIPVEPPLLYEDDDLGKSLKDARLCLFNFDKKPKPIMIVQMVDALGKNGADAEQVCAKLEDIVTDSVNGVRVTNIVPHKLENLADFLSMEPADIESTWMMRTSITSGKESVFLYLEPEKLELYYPPASAKLASRIEQEVDSEFAIELVPIPANTNDIALMIARTSLFRKNKSMKASQEDLVDMVARMANVKIPANDKAGIEKFYKTMYPTGGARATSNREWTWAPAEGKTPKEPKFYFTPKPPRAGAGNVAVANESGFLG
jgi:hypothetical protein